MPNLVKVHGAPGVCHNLNDTDSKKEFKNDTTLFILESYHIEGVLA